MKTIQVKKLKKNSFRIKMNSLDRTIKKIFNAKYNSNRIKYQWIKTDEI